MAKISDNLQIVGHFVFEEEYLSKKIHIFVIARKK